ncbi:MAG TPA: thiamine phosphate synthase [Blastocatellia bacterium]|nr:thiamine phosphate synthase [Blastocatellia bacterium]
MAFALPRLYPISDERLSGLSHASQVERLAAGGATLIQLRDKTASPREFYNAALEAMKIARRLGVQIVINDRIDIAIAVNADGVHLGQLDIPPEHARRLLGEGRIVGFSTHNLKQVVEADHAVVDYIALGPVFQTSTKENPDSVVGLEAVAEIKRQISSPLVAIGGITLARARSVIDAGADCVAVISDLFSSGDISRRTQEFIEVMR